MPHLSDGQALQARARHRCRAERRHLGSARLVEEAGPAGAGASHDSDRPIHLPAHFVADDTQRAPRGSDTLQARPQAGLELRSSEKSTAAWPEANASASSAAGGAAWASSASMVVTRGWWM
jgi:hypothetical protein